MVKAYATRFAKGTIDKENSVIYGVSVITEGVAEGHGEVVDSLTLQQVQKAAADYSGGLKVVDRHTRSTDSVFATVGTLRNFRIEGKQLLADMHILKSEPNAGKLFDMAETMPDAFGLSIAFSGPREVREGVSYSRCSEIYNAALVDVPAANPTGLFSTPDAEVKLALVDANPKQTMNPEEILKKAQEQFTAALSEYGTRLKKIEDAFAAQKPASAEEFSALKSQVTELSKSLDTAKTELGGKIADRSVLAVEIAKEFSKHTGTSTGVRTDGAADTRTGDDKAKLGDELNAAVQKHYAATKSKPEAIRKAVAERKEFGPLLQSGFQVKYA